VTTRRVTFVDGVVEGEAAVVEARRA